MRLHALLAFFDEPESLITLCVDGFARAGVDQVVAVDGRYALFPADEAVSPGKQRGLLDAACRHHGLGLTVHTPPVAWAGGEVQKRTALFALALALSDPDDWWFVCDTDMVVTEVPDDLHARLVEAVEDSAEMRLVDTLARQADRPDWPAETRFRGLYRAQPIVVRGHHCDYFNALDGRPLWKGADPTGLDPALDLTDGFVVEHRPRRDMGRTMQKSQYYARRDGTGLEMGTCTRCSEHATERVHSGPRMVDGLPTARIEEVCAAHAKELNGIRRRWLLQHGMNPNVRFNERYLGIEPARK